MAPSHAVPKFISRSHFFTPTRFSARRFFTSTPPPPSGTGAEVSTNARSRLQKFNDRLPAFLRGYTTPLLGAPATHITSFLVFHELTAVAPLFGLFGAFHYAGWMPTLTIGEGGPFNEAVQRFGKWMTKKGWVDTEDVEIAKTASSTGDEKSQVVSEQKGAQLVLEFAAAYAVTKALLPVRIAVSVWATPWFARVFIGPLGRGMRRIFQKRSA
ncbi:hypothetical protein BGW36DRAFT_372235 [Talaromyces proteolyticus]|uniref:DUF1279 domain-containing protein n=1 Tax=Talaromyces proteolyticus TaxID=1131652 RepID=A0AAD4KVR7_9EURO|nr:uncharacterized protein BGW36DRAFT_372235 [Talaromyces proteolyticus]KAH8702118.1 hypothetical protein BGW36DRAFT_372235 [Talaromyces proteolyticus]